MSRRARPRAAADASAAPRREVRGPEAGATSSVSPLLQVLVAVVVAALVFVIYWPSMHGPFLFDDVGRIERNAQIRITSLDPSGLLAAGFEGADATRPVAMMTFALNYYAHGLTTTGFHVVNVAIHLLSGFAFYYFATLTLRLRPLRQYAPRAREIAFFAALLWLLHPLATQAVSYLVQRMTALSGLFYLLSLISYVRGRLIPGTGARWAWFAACGVAAVLALGSKETAITLPAVILLYEWYFFQDLDRAWLRKVSPVLAGGALVGLVALVRLAPLSGYAAYTFTLSERLMTEARVVVYYLSLIALPHPSRLSADYSFPVSTSLLAPVTTLLSMGAIAGLLMLAWTTAKAHRLVSFGILWYLGNLVLESTVIPLDLVFEHRNYVPSMGVWLMAVALACRYGTAPWLRRGALTAVAVVLSLWTYQRNAVWSDALAFWVDTASKQPTLDRAQFNVGRERALRNDLHGAIDRYDEAIRLNPRYTLAYLARGLAKRAIGDDQGALADEDQAVRLNPAGEEALSNRAASRQSLGDYRGAVADYTAIIALAPNHQSAYINRGAAKNALKDYTGAIVDLTKAIEIAPQSAEAYNNRGTAKQGLGDNRGAIDDYNKALSLQADHVNAYANRGAAKVALQDYAGAMTDLTKVIELNPRLTNAYINRGHARHLTGDLKGSIADFSEALSIDARSEVGYLNRAVARHDVKDYRGAVADYTALLALNPKFARGFFNRGFDRLAIQDAKGACEDFRAAAQLGYPGADANARKYCG